ncbi:hypothetical protein COOONC_27664 [Cooperia oncophora]
MLWVSGAAVARMEDRSLSDSGLMSFIYDWTDVTPVFGAPRRLEGPLHIEFDDRPDVVLPSLCLNGGTTQLSSTIYATGSTKTYRCAVPSLGCLREWTGSESSLRHVWSRNADSVVLSDTAI